MAFQPGEHFNDHLVLLNLTQLQMDDNSNVVVDGVLQSPRSPTSPMMFLQSPSASKITIGLHQAEPLTVHYWLVNAKCSGKAVLKMDQKKRSIFPELNEQIENQRESATPVRCAVHYTTDKSNQFAVQLHSSTGLADLADSMYFYNTRGVVVVERNNLVRANSAPDNEKTLIDVSSVLVVYESPYVVSPIANFQVPQIEAISKEVNETSFNQNISLKVKAHYEWGQSQVLAGNKHFKVLMKFESLNAFNGDVDSEDHAFLVLYHNNSVIQLSHSIGQLTFSFNTKSAANVLLKFKPSRQFNDQLLMLNFTQLPVNANSTVTVDGVQLNSTSPKMFLQSPTSPAIILTLDMPQVEPLPFSWWFVSKKCSKKAVLKYGDQAQPVLYPNVTKRQQQMQIPAPIRCAMHFTADVGYQFGIDLPSQTGIADPADSLYFYNEQGRVALELNHRAGLYNGNESVLIDTNTAVVIYESPYDTFQHYDFKAPLIKVILTQVGVKFMPAENTIHLIVSKDDFVKNMELSLPSVTSLRRLEASPRVPMFSLFKYSNQATFVIDSPLKSVANGFINDS